MLIMPALQVEFPRTRSQQAAVRWRKEREKNLEGPFWGPREAQKDIVLGAKEKTERSWNTEGLEFKGIQRKVPILNTGHIFFL